MAMLKPRRCVMMSVVCVALLVLVAVPACWADTYSSWKLFGGSFWVPCANGGDGEWVEIVGWWHRVIGSSMDRNYGLHIAWQDHAYGFGVGAETGDEYVFSTRWPLVHHYISNDTSEIIHGGLEEEAATIRVIGRGRASNFMLRVLIHTTINANGEMTVDIERTDVVCR